MNSSGGRDFITLEGLYENERTVAEKSISVVLQAEFLLYFRPQFTSPGQSLSDVGRIVAVPTQSPGPAHHRETWFTTTEWSVILAAANSKDPGAQEALASLCHIYWHPIYAYIRRRGYPRENAQDLTQGFFTQLLEKKRLKAARSDRGRFRSFLLASVKNYLANEWDRERAQKRGGGQFGISLDFNGAEALWIEPVDPVTPESIFERRWALTTLAQVMDQLRKQMIQSGHEARFVRLRGFLTGEDTGLQYKQAADELKMSEGAVRVAVHRLRHRFGELLRREVARTIQDPKKVEYEIRYLFSAIDS